MTIMNDARGYREGSIFHTRPRTKVRPELPHADQTDKRLRWPNRGEQYFGRESNLMPNRIAEDARYLLLPLRVAFEVSWLVA